MKRFICIMLILIGCKAQTTTPALYRAGEKDAVNNRITIKNSDSVNVHIEYHIYHGDTTKQ